MRKRTLARTVGATVAAFGIVVGTAATASAINNIKPFGVQETINDWGTGGPMIGYRVTGLQPTSDDVPYPFAGRPYEATVQVDAFGSWAHPVVSMFNARAENGDNYRVLTDVSTLSGAAVPPDGSTTGKIYFDVVAADPNSVVFSDGGQDLLGWV